MKLISWIEHLRRHPECLQSCFLDVQDDFWLRERRALVGGLGASRSIFAGATRTRSGPGFPLRFFSKWLEECDSQDRIENPCKAKMVTQQHADHLFRFILETRENALALLDG